MRHQIIDKNDFVLSGAIRPCVDPSFAQQASQSRKAIVQYKKTIGKYLRREADDKESKVITLGH